MSDVLTPRQTEQGWVDEMTPDVLSSLGIVEGAKILLTSRQGGLSPETPPPLSPELKEISQYLLKQNQKIYEALKQVGD